MSKHKTTLKNTSEDKKQLSDQSLREEAALIAQLRDKLSEREKEIELLRKKIRKEDDLKEIKHALNQLQRFLLLAPFHIYFKNENLEYTYVNQSFAALSNQSIESLIGKNNAKTDFGNYLEALEVLEKKVLASGNTIANAELCLGIEQEKVLLNVFLFPMTDSKSDQIQGVMVCSFDISDRLQYKQALKQAENKAMLGIQSKQTFLANLSHEIRTPLHGILGSTALLTNLLNDRDAFELLENINSSGTSLLQMVDSVLLLESLEKGEWKMKAKTLEIRPFVEQCTQQFSDVYKLKNIDIQCFIAQGMPKELNGDFDKLYQLLSILLNNAIKFTEKGFIHLFVQSEELNENKIRVKFSLKDTGLGIKKEVQADLFNLFTQGDSSSTKGYQGVGIGLAMAKKTVAFLGGEIGFESEEYKGSTFWISLDLNAVNQQKQHYLTPAETPVLLVEDNKINQKIAFFTLKKLGFPVEIAENGLEAIERYQSQTFKIILMDIQMPIMNGFDATTKIRAYEKQKELPSSLIIALSANTVKEDVENCFFVGMNEYISKPFSPEKLSEVIQKHLAIKLA
ncbi:MAG: response regulator [Bacteroidales bacterium]|nr:response regulator [Bacteroidales bacterium]